LQYKGMWPQSSKAQGQSVWQRGAPLALPPDAALEEGQYIPCNTLFEVQADRRCPAAGAVGHAAFLEGY